MIGLDSRMQFHKCLTRYKEKHTISTNTKLHNSLELKFSFELTIFSYWNSQCEFQALRIAPSPKQHPHKFSQFREEQPKLTSSVFPTYVSSLCLQTHKMLGNLFWAESQVRVSCHIFPLLPENFHSV